MPGDPTLTHDLLGSLDDFDFAQFGGMEAGAVESESFDAGVGSQMYGGDDWFQGDQQGTGVVDGEGMFGAEQ